MAAVAVVGLIALAASGGGRARSRSPQAAAARAGVLEGARDVVGRSIAMDAFRRLTDRPSSPRVGHVPPGPGAAAPGDRGCLRTTPVPEVRSRDASHSPWRGVPSPRAVPVPNATSRAAVSFYETERPRPALAGVPITGPAAPPLPGLPPRERLVRDTGIALVVLTVLGLAFITFGPHGSSGRPGRGDPGVVRASGRL